MSDSVLSEISSQSAVPKINLQSAPQENATLVLDKQDSMEVDTESKTETETGEQQVSMEMESESSEPQLKNEGTLLGADAENDSGNPTSLDAPSENDSLSQNKQLENIEPCPDRVSQENNQSNNDQAEKFFSKSIPGHINPQHEAEAKLDNIMLTTECDTRTEAGIRTQDKAASPSDSSYKSQNTATPQPPGLVQTTARCDEKQSQQQPSESASKISADRQQISSPSPSTSVPAGTPLSLITDCQQASSPSPSTSVPAGTPLSLAADKDQPPNINSNLPEAHHTALTLDAAGNSHLGVPDSLPGCSVKQNATGSNSVQQKTTGSNSVQQKDSDSHDSNLIQKASGSIDVEQKASGSNDVEQKASGSNDVEQNASGSNDMKQKASGSYDVKQKASGSDDVKQEVSESDSDDSDGSDFDDSDGSEPIDFFACEDGEDGELVLRALVKEEAMAQAVTGHDLHRDTSDDSLYPLIKVKSEHSGSESLSSDTSGGESASLPADSAQTSKTDKDGDKLTVPTALYMTELLPFYRRGLDNYSTLAARELLHEAVQKTGLTEAQIKRWVDNYKRKHRHAIKPSARRLKMPKRRTRSIDLFYRENLRKYEGSKTERMAAVAAAWRSASDMEKERYRVAARAMPLPDQSFPNQPTLRKRRIREILSNMDTEVKSLEELGYRGVLLLTVDKDGKFTAGGTTRCVNWIQEQKAIQKVLIGTCFEDEVPKTEHPDQIRLRVQQLFNNKYREAGGVGKCSYKSLDLGLLTAQGFPEGVSFKRPSAYGASDLSKIVKNENNIRFLIQNKTKKIVGQEAPQKTNPEPITSSISDTLSKESISDTSSKNNISAATGNVTISDTPSKLTISDTPGKDSITGTPSRLTISDTPSKVSITNTPSRRTISDTPSKVTISDTPSEVTISDTPSGDTGRRSGRKRSSVNYNLTQIQTWSPTPEISASTRKRRIRPTTTGDTPAKLVKQMCDTPTKLAKNRCDTPAELAKSGPQKVTLSTDNSYTVVNGEQSPHDDLLGKQTSTSKDKDNKGTPSKQTLKNPSDGLLGKRTSSNKKTQCKQTPTRSKQPRSAGSSPRQHRATQETTTSQPEPKQNAAGGEQRKDQDSTPSGQNNLQTLTGSKQDSKVKCTDKQTDTPGETTQITDSGLMDTKLPDKIDRQGETTQITDSGLADTKLPDKPGKQGETTRITDSRLPGNTHIEEKNKNTQPPETSTGESLPEGFYEVEKILQERKRRGKVLYLVKWKGYDTPSWEPRKNVTQFAIRCFRQSRSGIKS